MSAHRLRLWSAKLGFEVWDRVSVPAAAGTDSQGRSGKVATKPPPKGLGDTAIGHDPDYSMLLADVL